MKPLKTITTHRIPDVHSLKQAPERSVLHVLATATRCARLSVMLEFQDLFDAPADGPPHDLTPRALDMAASQLVARLEDVLAAVDLYEAALRDYLRHDQEDLF